MQLSIKNFDDIMGLKPCYDPAAPERGYITTDWTGTALDILHIEAAPTVDRFWVVFREGWLPDRLMHEFSIWCAEQALALIDEPDPRSLNALEVKRQWLDGNATDEDLAAAGAAARAAAWAAARNAARYAAGAAAWAAAWAAAGDAARAAAWAAAWAAAGDAQVAQLIKMLEDI